MGKKGLWTVLFGFLAVIFAAGVIFAAVFCRNMPPVLVKAPEDDVRRIQVLMDTVCSGDFAGAAVLLRGTSGGDRRTEPEDPVGKMIWDAYVQRLDDRLEGDLYVTDRGLAQDIKLIRMELDSATELIGLRARQLLTDTINGAQDMSELYDADNSFRQELVDEIMAEATRQALEEDVKYTYDIFPVQLVYGDGQWKIEADQKFWKAVSGGISENSAVLDNFDMYTTNLVVDALADVLSIDKVYWLQDEDMVAPQPDPQKYGKTADPRDMTSVLQQAEKLIRGQDLIFSTDVSLRPDSEITWYQDETILTITWQQQEGRCVFTCSEVFIAHPSQFRRFLSDGKFGSGKLYLATQMAADVNAVVASNGDYYGYRGYGNLVYNGKVEMAENRYLDVCYVDDKGDLLLMDLNSIYKKQDVEAFVEENNIRFSLAFGPILLEDGKVVAKHYYALGETDRPYSRAALCQIGPLHYMLVTANRQGMDVTKFASYLKGMGVPKAYALDGGQTCTIVMNDELMNPVDYGGQRKTSDIIYFATAVPDGE